MEQSSGIAVIDKAVSLMDAVAGEPASLTELVERTSLPRATAYRVAVALERQRLLTRDESGRWQLGPRISELAAVAPDPLLVAAPRALARAVERTGESAQLYRRDGSTRVCVAAVERTTGLRDGVPVGARLPMTAGSAAQALLAWEPSAEQERMLLGARFSTEDLALVRVRGWAASVAERESGVASVSVPVHDTVGRVVAAVSVSGPISRLGPDPGPRHARVLEETAAALQGAGGKA